MASHVVQSRCMTPFARQPDHRASTRQETNSGIAGRPVDHPRQPSPRLTRRSIKQVQLFELWIQLRLVRTDSRQAGFGGLDVGAVRVTGEGVLSCRGQVGEPGHGRPIGWMGYIFRRQAMRRCLMRGGWDRVQGWEVGRRAG